MMNLLNVFKIKLAKTLAISLIILKGISSDCADFQVYKLLMSFRISS